MKNKIINTSLLLICMISIFLFSCQDRDSSTNTSVETTKVVVSTVSRENIDSTKVNDISNNIFYIIRKSAHFIEFFILGLLVINVVKDYYKINYKYLIICVLFCLIYSISDEVHQIYVLGRSCQIKDVIIDTIGSGVGIMIYYLIGRKQLVLKN